MSRDNNLKLVIVPGGKIGVQTDYYMGQYYVGGYASGQYHEAPAALTEFTPEVCKQLLVALPSTVFSARTYSTGQTGTDPEIFAFTDTGKVIPAWTFLKSPKEDPYIYWDGVQGEMTVVPHYCHSYLTDNVRTRLLALYQALKKHDATATLIPKDVVRLDKHTLLSAEDKHIMLGCAPSKNAYPKTKPIDIGNPRSHAYRYSGTHLHYSVLEYPAPPWFPDGTVVMMDKILGLLLTAMGRDWEDPRRRRAYGRAGEYRVPVAGQRQIRLEYRTPGSFLLHHPAIFNFAADVGRAAFRMGLLVDGRQFTELPDVHKIINSCDADAALEVINTKKSFFSDLFTQSMNQVHYNVAATMDVLRTGALASGRFGKPLARNWLLDGSGNWITHNGSIGKTWSSVI